MATNFYQANPNLKAIGVNLQYTKEQIEEYGIAKFNEFCRQDVLKYSNISI